MDRMKEASRLEEVLEAEVEADEDEEQATELSIQVDSVSDGKDRQVAMAKLAAMETLAADKRKEQHTLEKA